MAQTGYRTLDRLEFSRDETLDMRSGTRSHLRLLALVAVLVPAPLHAGGVEITPFAGGRFGGTVTESGTNRDLDLDPSASYGLVFDVALKQPGAFIEIVLSHQETEAASSRDDVDLSLDSIHVGGLFRWQDRRVQPFLNGGFGLTIFDADGAEAHFSATLGTGFRVPLGQRAAFRFDARGIGIFDSGGSGIFCTGGCLVSVSVAGTLQGEVAVSFTFAP